jgi:TonB family protein
MLHWQHKSEQARIQFWVKLGVVVLFFHICVLGYLLFVSNVYNVYHVAFNASRIATQAPVVFMPLYKRIQSEKSSEICNKTSDVAKKKKTQSLAKAKKENSTVVSLEPKSIAKKQGSKKTKQKTNEKKASQESAKQYEKKEEAKKVAIQKEQVKNATSSLPLVEKKQAAKKQEIKPQADSKEAQKQSEASKVPQDIKNNAGVAEQASDKTTPMYLGQEEWYSLQVQEALQAELVKHWNVPAGLATDLMCQVAVVVNRQGVIEKVRIIESSGVLAFDISARTAASKMQLPLIARGKEFVITFKQ